MIAVLRNKGKGSYGEGGLQVLPEDIEIIEDPATRLSSQTLLAANWVENQVSGLFEYAFKNTRITANTEVEFIPHAVSEDVVSAAEIKTHTPVSLGQVLIQAVNAPGGDIVVDVLIQNVKDV